MASLDGQLSDSVSIAARGVWRQAATGTGVGSDVALMRVGVPMVPPSLAITSPTLQLGLGLTGGGLSDLTGSYLSGTGVSLGTRLGEWKLSGIAARPYSYGATADTAGAGEMANARIEHPLGSGTLSITATHLDDPSIGRQLDAASLGASLGETAIGDIKSELGYRRYADGAGLGWSAELQHQTDDESFSLRTLHAPGGVQAYARATDELSAAGSRRLADWVSLTGAYWRSGDASRTLGSSSGSGWSFGPTFNSHSLGANLSVQGRGSSIDVAGQAGGFGSSDAELAAVLDVHRGVFFTNEAASVGRISRTLSAGDEALPTLSGGSSQFRGSVGANVASGTLAFDASAQEFQGSAGMIPQRTSLGVRAEHIAIPLGERMRVYAGADVERLGFSVGGQSPLSSRFSLSAPIGFGFDITASAERNPFLTVGTNGGWITAIRVDHSQYLSRLVSPGQSFRVYRDLNGNGVRDRGEPGFAGLVVRCGSRTVVTDRDGRFKCDASEAPYVDPRSLPAGWVAPGMQRERTAGDIGLIAITAVHVHIDLLDIDTLRVPRKELEKLVLIARDTANQPWLARDLGAGELIFDALPPGRYTVDVDASGIDEPLSMKGRPDFVVGEGSAKDLRVVLTGRTLRVRVLPPTQSGGSSDSTAARARAGARSSSKENVP
jgi:hypothetical protein